MSSSNFEEINQPGSPANALLSSKEIRKISEGMKSDLEIRANSMEDAIKFSMEEKTKTAVLKAMVLEKEDEVRKTSEDIVAADRRIINSESIIAELEKELNNIKTAIEGIKEITSDLDPLDAEKAAGSLKGALIGKQTDLEKARGELNSLRKSKTLQQEGLLRQNCLCRMQKNTTLKKWQVQTCLPRMLKSQSPI